MDLLRNFVGWMRYGKERVGRTVSFKELADLLKGADSYDVSFLVYDYSNAGIFWGEESCKEMCFKEGKDVINYIRTNLAKQYRVDRKEVDAIFDADEPCCSSRSRGLKQRILVAGTVSHEINTSNPAGDGTTRRYEIEIRSPSKDIYKPKEDFRFTKGAD